MKIKPKEIYVNLPIALTFNKQDEVPAFASTINTIIHGKVKIKCEEIGFVGGQYVGLFYLQRNGEYQDLRNSFLELIEAEEINNPKTYPHDNPITFEELLDNDLFSTLDKISKES